MINKNDNSLSLLKVALFTTYLKQPMNLVNLLNLDNFMSFFLNHAYDLQFMFLKFWLKTDQKIFALPGFLNWDVSKQDWIQT